MKKTRTLTLMAAASAAAIPLAIGVSTISRAGATPGSGSSGTIVAQGATSDPVHVQATGDSRFVDQQVTIQPGGYTGWHYHPGPLLVIVASGTLTHYDDNCTARTYSAGQSFEEEPGHQHVHMGANLGSEPVVLDVTYVLAAGDPLRVDAPAPACAAGL